MNTNPLIDFNRHPNFSDIAPAAVGDAIGRVIDEAQATVAAVIADTAPPSWESLLMPLEAATERIMRVWNQVELMHSVMSDEAWQKAHTENLGTVVAFFAAMNQNTQLYERMRTLAQSAEFTGLSEARRRVVLNALRDFELAGVALPPAPAQQFRKNSEELAGLAAQFEQNLLAATDDFSCTVDKEADLGDMPADLRQTAAQTDGKFRFTLHPPSYSAFMQYVRDRPLRERMYRAYTTRASELGRADWDNTPLMTRIMQKRQEQATLLGFSDYAEYALQTRMAPSADAIPEFLQDLARRAMPFARTELQTLRDFAAEALAIDDLQAWDIPFASECLRRRLFDYSDADLRPYLQEDKILTGLFDCVKKHFGVRVRPAAETVARWHSDVRYMEVITADGTAIGGLYLDLYARENKRGGAWMADALSRYRHPKTGLQRPLAHIICNFTKPADGGIALLNWNEAVTLFHECGHALHHLLTEVDEYAVSGISGVEWDAVELPSQLLENFIWDWRVLQPMTAHADSGETMPRPLFDKVLAGRRFQSGLFLLRQLEFALFDFLLHRQPQKNADNDFIGAVLATVRDEVCLLPPPEYNRFQNGFSHIFAGGYAAGYYSYLWAEVLAADIFEMFEDDNNSDIGKKFRQEVLAVGGSRPAMESFKALRHREPDIRPLLKHYNLT